MSKDILYYPTIEFNSEDYQWLWISSLLWDKIYRIVPEKYSLHEPRNIQELCSSGEIGIPLSPNRYQKMISEDFLRKIESKDWQAAALEFHHDDVDRYSQYCRIHKDKIDVTLKNILLFDKNILEDDDWVYTSREMSNLYMTYLARHMAQENKLSLTTNNKDIWTASTFFLHDQQIQDSFYPGSDSSESSQEALASLILNDFIPQNIMDVTAKDLLTFRERRKDERNLMIKAIDDFADSISGITDPQILDYIVNDENKKVTYAITEYKKSMDNTQKVACPFNFVQKQRKACLAF